VRVDGILNVLKPSGKTSFDVVSCIRRLSGESRVGHTGTLDPDATGVLVVCLGQGTRMIEFLSRAEKTYRAEIELGVSTDTNDATGIVLDRRDIRSVTEEQVRRAVNTFCGAYDQVPPMYSALKQRGKRLYELARQGIEVPRKPRRVDIFRLSLLDWRPPMMTIEVDCGGGTYIRALARDIGESLGCGAHLSKLVRLRSQPFSIDDATDLVVLEEAFSEGWWPSLLYSIDEVLLEWKAVILSGEEETQVKKGGSVMLRVSQDSPSASTCRAYSAEGHFVAVLTKLDGGMWRPRKVFRATAREL
jgi:tRNA pseudouridine55 synthase